MKKYHNPVIMSANIFTKHNECYQNSGNLHANKI